MAGSKIIFCLLLSLMFLFMAGCSLSTRAPSATPETALPTTQNTSPPTGESIQTLTSTPTLLPITEASATSTYTPTIVLSATPSNPATLGLSTGGHPIEAYRYGSGPTSVVLIGGLHGGYEWNTILLAYEFIDYFEMNPDVLHPNLTIYVIPSANPDGQVQVVGHAGRFLAEEVQGDTFEGRFNDNGVDLNRNWDCDWSQNAVWRDLKLNPGTQPFSEVETGLLRDFILAVKPAGVIFWHSAYPAVFPGACHNGHEPSLLLSEIYASAANYPMLETFTSYNVTGDSTNWLALQDIASIEVELTNHEETDFDINLKGVLSVLDFLANQPLTTPVLTPSTK